MGRTTSSISSASTLPLPSHLHTIVLLDYHPVPVFKMKFFATALALLPALTTAHTIAQRVRVNGQDNGQGNGIRVASSNNPIMNVNDGNIACNTGTSSSSKVIDVKAGDKIGVQWGHVVGGAQFANDKDHPIAASHKGPTIFYL